MHGRVKLANGLMKARNYNGASQVLTQHLQHHADDVDALYLYATSLYRTGDPVRAEAAYRRVMALAPGHALAHYGLGAALADAGRTAEARKALEAALRLDPNLEGARRRLARLAPKASGPPAAPPAGTDGDEEHLTPGELLGSGHRRLSSFAGRFLLAAVLLGTGLALLLTHEPDRLRWFAERPPFQQPSLDFLRDRAAATGQPEHLQEVEDAVERADSLSDAFDAVAVAVAVALAAGGVLLAAHAVLASDATRYDVFQRRIDVHSGVLNRRSSSTWLYEIVDVDLRQSPMLTLTGNAELRIRLPQTGYAKPSRFGDRTLVRVIGFGSLDDQRRLRQELRDAALRERRAMRRGTCEPPPAGRTVAARSGPDGAAGGHRPPRHALLDRPVDG